MPPNRLREDANLWWCSPRDPAWPQWTVTFHRPARNGNRPILVTFVRRIWIFRLRRDALWLPTVGAWDKTRWAPTTSPLPPKLLSLVETVLSGGHRHPANS